MNTPGTTSFLVLLPPPAPPHARLPAHPPPQTIDLSGNELRGSLPAHVSALTKLLRLDMSSNQLSGAIPAQFGYLTGLTELDLSSNNLRVSGRQ
jgi:Leucine-rich repeat (LRR) protein